MAGPGVQGPSPPRRGHCRTASTADLQLGRPALRSCSPLPAPGCPELGRERQQPRCCEAFQLAGNQPPFPPPRRRWTAGRGHVRCGQACRAAQRRQGAPSARAAAASPGAPEPCPCPAACPGEPGLGAAKGRWQRRCTSFAFIFASGLRAGDSSQQRAEPSAAASHCSDASGTVPLISIKKQIF